jgi:folylpolyglutamate synthase/dihydropteroate synthase
MSINKLIHTIKDYPSTLRYLYALNANLSRGGVQAPSHKSLDNTRLLYELIGKPLDKIPTVIIGGTNGKVLK